MATSYSKTSLLDSDSIMKTICKRTWCLAAVVLFFICDCSATIVAPHIAPLKDPEDLEEGQRLAILCAVRKGSLPISFSWRKDNVPIVPTHELRILHTEDYQETLQIEKLNADHVGNYTCSVKNMHGTDKMSVQVKLKFRPRWITTLPSAGTTKSGVSDAVIQGEAGGSINLDCRAQGYPTPNIRIYKGEITIIFSACYCGI